MNSEQWSADDGKGPVRTLHCPLFTVHSRNKRGAAYLLAITTLLVGTALALAMLRATSGYFIAETSRDRKRAAANLAEAGVDYAYWQIHYNGAHLPYSATVALATGSFQVSAVDDGNRDRSTVLITSTGTAGREKYTLCRVALGLLPYHYARCENGNISDGDTLISPAPGRGLRANGSIWLGSLSNNVTTGGWATTTISAWGTLSPRFTNSSPIRFPDIDWGYYTAVATYFHPGDVTYTSPSFPGQSVVIVAEHDVRIQGAYSGVITILAGHDVKVTGNLVAADSSSYIALLAYHLITIESAATNVEGLFYCHNLAMNGQVSVKGVTTITGSVCGDTVSTDRTTAFNPMPRLNLYAMRRLRLPGL